MNYKFGTNYWKKITILVKALLQFDSGITNRGKRDYKMGQKYDKLGQGLQIGGQKNVGW